MEIKRAVKEDLKEIIQIGSESFSGLKDIKNAEKWVSCNFAAFPRTQYFIAKKDNAVVGYVLWIEKGGFRENSVWELEQIATKKDVQGQGIGGSLIEKSFIEIKRYLDERGSKLKAVEVTTGTDNKAQNLYKKFLGAEVECIVRDLFRGDEAIMIARPK
jgi:GNAT superfamily N-acetyltransferase